MRIFLVFSLIFFYFSSAFSNGVSRNPWPWGGSFNDKLIFDAMDVAETLVPPTPGLPYVELQREKKLGRLHCGRYHGNSDISCYIQEKSGTDSDYDIYENLLVKETLVEQEDILRSVVTKTIERLTCTKYERHDGRKSFTICRLYDPSVLP